VVLRLTAAGRDLAWEGWEDLHVVFQRTSGETHVFNETTRAILGRLQDGPLALDEMVRLLARAMGIDEAGLAREDFLAVTARLDELGLIERVDRPSSDS
jgi:PqqD family protein of HPr-rel-A system